MNILYHHRTLGDGAEGIHVSSIVEAFRALGHDVRLISLIGKEVAVSTPRVRMLEQVRRRMPRSLYEVMEIGYSVAGYRLLTGQINGWKPEFLYERYMLFNMAGLMAARRLGIPLVLEVNAPLAYERAQYERLSLKRAAQLFERSLFRSADLVLTVSTPLKDYIVHQGVPPANVFVLPNGTKPELFRPNAAARQRGSAATWHSLPSHRGRFRRNPTAVAWRRVIVGGILANRRFGRAGVPCHCW